MKNKRLVIFTVFALGVSGHSLAKDKKAIEIAPANKAPLLNGNCNDDVWRPATTIALPANVYILLMHDDDYFYICVRSKADDINVLDLYVESDEVKVPFKYHLSAQMGERKLTENGWENTSQKWELKDYAGFWVPYSGLEDPENRKNPKFARGTHRQVQIARKKFPGTIWNMMFGVSGIKHEDEWAAFVHPERAAEDDRTTWERFTFSE
ncbi:hypothetical protein [Alteromonas facilis]|uniref:hypothetical protein n=1 Tax=Alteromonas facilis TaxID=2048004 RepID=UPI000C286D6E|nr:hypothetical protein [Alteromonas facilis]